jgi:hypothetical protein
LHWEPLDGEIAGEGAQGGERKERREVRRGGGRRGVVEPLCRQGCQFRWRPISAQGRQDGWRPFVHLDHQEWSYVDPKGTNDVGAIPYK